MTYVRAKFSGGALHPLEPLSLAEGQEVLVSIEESPAEDSAMGWAAPESAGRPGPTPEQTREALRETAGAWKGNSDPEELKRRIYSDRLANSRPSTRP